MTEQRTHPAPEILSAFSLGQLPPADAEAIEAHVGECQPCCETLLGLCSDDTFVALLQKANHAPGDETRDRRDHLHDTMEVDNAEIPSALVSHSRYAIVAPIGKGGMGNVFKAEHRMMERTVALKVIKQEFLRKPEAVSRFKREVKTAARLSHPNIVTAHDAEQAGNVHFLVMEFVNGVDLARRVKDSGPLPITEACESIRQAALGLQHAHDQGMVHRDIKPHNLMVTTDGTVKILDFGLATLAKEGLTANGVEEPARDNALTSNTSRLTTLGAMMGTPDFISPEQACEPHGADVRSDIYSLGCTFYFLLTGRPPFPEGSALERIKAHSEQEAVSIQNVRDDVPPELTEILRRMMAKDPSERFQTPAEIADALAPFVDAHRTTPAQDRVRDSLKVDNRSWWPPKIIQSIACTAFAFILAGVIYVATDNGTLEVISDDESVEIVVRGRDGLRIVDTLTGSNVTRLRRGEYAVELKSDDNDFELDNDRFVLKRREKVIVRVTSHNQGSTSLPSPSADISQSAASGKSGLTNSAPTIEVLIDGVDTISPDLTKVLVTPQSVRQPPTIKDRLSGNKLKVSDEFTGYASSNSPVWSHDSKSVAHVFFTGSEFNGRQIRIASAMDGKVRSLPSFDYKRIDIQDWSPDGQSILCLVENRDSSSALVTFSVEGGEVRQLYSVGWDGTGHARYSPDGRYIAFAKAEGQVDRSTFRIYIYDTADRRVSRLTESMEAETNPVWTADGRYVLYTGAETLRAADFDMTKPAKNASFVRADWNDFGKRLTSSGQLMFRKYNMFTHMYSSLVSDDGLSAPERMKPSLSANTVAWSPDGSELVYKKSRGELTIVSAEDGSVVRTINPGISYLRFVHWSPDGKTLAIGPGAANDPIGVSSYSFDTRESKLLAPYPRAQDTNAIILPKGFTTDGKEFVVYSSVFEDDSVPEFLAYNVNTKEVRRVEFPGSQRPIHQYDVSPDGELIAYVTKEGSDVWRLSVSDRSFREATEIDVRKGSSREPVFLHPRWSPDGAKLLYLAGKKLRVSSADGKWQKTLKTGKLRHWWHKEVAPVWSPDGSRLTYALTEGPYVETCVLSNNWSQLSKVE